MLKMDLIISYKSRFRLWKCVFIVITLYCHLTFSWRISSKCPQGHYYNDGCTACWCDTQTGFTKCEQLQQCSRPTSANRVKCPRGRTYKDRCGNDCSCFERTGAVLCNEKRKCPPEMPSIGHTTPMPPLVTDNGLRRREGIVPPYIPPVEKNPIQLRFPGVSPIPPRAFASPSPTTTARNDGEYFYQNVAIASTPHPHIRIPSREQSEELIIEPAIIVRKKGSNKASIVRNPSSATSVTLPSTRRRNQDLILTKGDNARSDTFLRHTPRSTTMGPLQLYEKQLQTILNIRRAYSHLLRSKVNFNFQMATGNIPLKSKGATFVSSTDHPRRFDSDFNNSTILVDTSPSPYPPLFMTSQQPRPPPLPPGIQVRPFEPLVWRKEIKNVLKQFSPVPPLKHLVSYVTTSTENYLRDYLNSKNRLELHSQQPIHILTSSQSTTPVTPTAPQVPYQSFTPATTPSPPPLYPFDPPFSTIAPPPPHELENDLNNIPIHEVYQNHNFKDLTHRRLSTISPQNSFDISEFDPKREQFPHMHDLMRQIIRMDKVPSTTPRPSPAITALPTFQTPGPPYAEIEEVRPLSFLPPPQPEPATPTKRIFTSGQRNNNHFPNSQHQYPFLEEAPSQTTVRVNLDKPIYINPPANSYANNDQPSSQYPPPPPRQQYAPPPQQQIPQPPPHQHRFHPFTNQQQFSMHDTNRRIHSIPHRPPNFAPPPIQRPLHLPPLLQQRHHVNHHQNNMHHQRPPLFPQFFMPKPKQYRLTLKGPVRDAAVRVDDVVPRFVNKIAHEFFKKPEIYVPKIRPGKPLTLERVVLNHKEIVPSEMPFSNVPGAPMTKLRFTPQAQWEMKEELAKQGIMLDEPLTTQIRDYAANDPNVMEMDAPIKAVNTWETHSSMGMGNMDYPTSGAGGSGVNVPELIQQVMSHQRQQILQQAMSNQQQQILQQAMSNNHQQTYNPFVLPTQSPSLFPSPSPTPEQQLQQDLQHQILLAQQNQHSLVGSVGHTSFKIDPGDFDDFKLDNDPDHHIFPQELQIPGVKEVVVDKYLVQDPLDPTGQLKMITTTTVTPPTVSPKMDMTSLYTLHRRNGLAALPAHGPTLPPSVLVRHHGAPSPRTRSPLLPTPTPPSMHATSYKSDNFLVTVINSTPQPFVATTITPLEGDPSLQISETRTGIIHQPPAGDGSNIVNQIKDFLTEEMDFGARPELNLYDMLFHQRMGEVAPDQANNENVHENGQHENFDQVAAETKSVEEGKVDTEKVADIFSMDYKNKYNKNPPAVIVIKVPPDHSDGPFPKVVEKRRGEALDQEDNTDSKTKVTLTKSEMDRGIHVETSTENSIAVTSSTTQTSISSEASGDDDEEDYDSDSSSAKRKRRRNRKNRKRKRRRRRKKNRRKDRNREAESQSAEESSTPSTKDSSSYNRTSTKKYNAQAQAHVEAKKEDPESTNVADLKKETAAAAAEEKFQSEIDWKSQLMANICELNPSSPLCLTYRSICLLMTSDD